MADVSYRWLSTYRILNALLTFMTSVQVGSLFSGASDDANFYAAWVFICIPFIIFSSIMSTKQFKVGLFKISIGSHIFLFAFTIVLLGYMISAIQREAVNFIWASQRIGLPTIICFCVLQLFSIVSAMKVLYNPIIMPIRVDPVEQNVYELHADDVEEEEDGEEETEDVLDGLGNASLYAASSSPTGFPRILPTIFQVLAVVPCFLWPFYILDVLILAFIRYENQESLALGAGLIVTYVIGMLIWIVGSIIVSFGYKNKQRTFAASIGGFIYLVWCIFLCSWKFNILRNDAFSPVLTVFHLLFLAPWCVIAYKLGTTKYNYTQVPMCPCCR